MVAGKSKITWDNPAKEYLKKSLQFIKRDSPQNAEKIKNAIKSVIKEIPHHPERYPADKYRLNNTETTGLYYFMATGSRTMLVRMKYEP